MKIGFKKTKVTFKLNLFWMKNFFRKHQKNQKNLSLLLFYTYLLYILHINLLDNELFAHHNSSKKPKKSEFAYLLYLFIIS